ncbi:Uncharacterized protein BM_BM11100 [Brugia malayi]|uniref:Bm11100 n=1 Tax=Brugia malayi TaxID=6279 RepID=A0A1P6BI98_BRUMA|nr:Uncharacterized protein BM_BM11100 [Brugia malayi]CDQ01277.1 Bm11100 [Brugia malayi]CDQ07861.1 Bm12194 [Brugia malayi]VIP00350.1 Uncharacterized protein BM_BM11100 [Brugia malayi]
MQENELIRWFVPLPTQFLQEEEPSDTDDDDEQNAEYNQLLVHFQYPAACVVKGCLVDIEWL